MLISQYYRENGLSASMALRPLHFMLLDNWSEIPPVYHGKERLTQCCHTVSLNSFDSVKYSDKFTVKENKAVIRLKLKGSKFPFNLCELYYDSKHKKFMVFTTGIKRYKKFAKLISEDINLPEVPELYATLPMIAGVKAMLGKDLPVMEYNRIFERREAVSLEEEAAAVQSLGEPAAGQRAERTKAPSAGPIKNNEIGKLNAFMQELTKRSNIGVGYSLPELSELYDIPMETAEQLENMLTKIDRRFSIEIDGGLSDFTPPPPDVRTMFRDGLIGNKLFSVNITEELREDFKIITAGFKPEGENAQMKFTFENFYDTLEYLAGRIWGRGGRTVLLYTFYMLCKKGFVFGNVRDYAVEFLKTFWQVILPDKKRKYLDEFIGHYSDFMLDVFFVFNLIDIDRDIDRGKTDAGDIGKDYRIKASDFFKKWVRLSDYLKE